ncbi:hypothetical protein ACLBW8_03885 [Pseudomonas sp. M5A4_2d]
MNHGLEKVKIQCGSGGATIRLARECGVSAKNLLLTHRIREQARSHN